MSLNVNEQTLREQIDPYLNPDHLSDICSKALQRPVMVGHAEILTGGCLNRVIGIHFEDMTPAMVLKINPTLHDDGLQHEFKVLEYFDSHTNMPVAKPLYFDDSGEIIPGTFFLMEKIEGVVMHQARLFPSEIKDVISQIAEIVVELHDHKEEGFGGVELPVEKRTPTWSDFWLNRFDGRIKRIRNTGSVPAIFFNRIDKIRKELPRLLQIGSKATLTHYDIWSGNVILSLNNGGVKVSCFLDVQGYWADYARELSFMEMFGLANKDFYHIYEAHHRLDENFQLRKNIYNLKMNLLHMEMYPGEYHYQLGAHSCLQFIEESL